MSTAHPDTLTDPVDVARSILAESMTPLDGGAFDRARVEFGRAYARAYKPSLPSEHDEAHDEALGEALQAFLGTYLHEARS